MFFVRVADSPAVYDERMLAVGLSRPVHGSHQALQRICALRPRLQEFPPIGFVRPHGYDCFLPVGRLFCMNGIMELLGRRALSPPGTAIHNSPMDRFALFPGQIRVAAFASAREVLARSRIIAEHLWRQQSYLSLPRFFPLPAALAFLFDPLLVYHWCGGSKA